MANTCTALVRDIATGNTAQVNLPMTSTDLTAAITALVTDTTKGYRVGRLWGLWDAQNGPDTLNKLLFPTDKAEWVNECARLLQEKSAGDVCALINSGYVVDLCQLANLLNQWASVGITKGTPDEIVTAYLTEHADPESQTLLFEYLDKPGMAAAVADVGAAVEGYEIDAATLPRANRWTWEEMLAADFDPTAPDTAPETPSTPGEGENTPPSDNVEESDPQP